MILQTICREHLLFSDNIAVSILLNLQLENYSDTASWWVPAMDYQLCNCGQCGEGNQMLQTPPQAAKTE